MGKPAGPTIVWPASIPRTPIEHSPDYASMWGGAHVRLIPGTAPQLEREARGLKRTVPEFRRLLELYPWTYCVNAPLYCGNLLRRFSLRTHIKAFNLRLNVLLSVNDSSFSFNDPNCFPTRAFLQARKTVTRQNKGRHWWSMILRFVNGGTVITDTKEPDDWPTEVDLETRQRILAYGREVDQTGVFREVVGRRPWP
ncbi:hypothetical protein LCI18_013866 [Fusarium solani-melongenae]|uniref:Uncharacterized protein n=1 Tax=Fusarium solani subsp. cucurbitae TaxID=2747967 RepID=A0ACD3ZPC1_FUSSC|nr:hypothetical protein LCI18_013866 [Fusarium solani-melongenae]